MFADSASAVSPSLKAPPPPSRRLCPPDKTLATPRGRPFHSRRSISFCPRQNFFSAPFSCFSALDPASTPSSATPGFEKKLQFCERDFKLFGDIFVSGGNRRWTLDIVSVGKCSILHFFIQLNYTNNMCLNYTRYCSRNQPHNLAEQSGRYVVIVTSN